MSPFGHADLVAVAVRALAFVAALQAAGVPLFRAVYGPALGRSAAQVERLGVVAAAAGLLLTLAYQVLQPARLTGSLAGVLDLDLQRLMLASDAGPAAALRLLGLALVLSACLKGGRGRDAAGIVGATLVAASFALMGHTATDDLRWLLAGLLVLHVLVAAFWFGALLPLHLALRHDPPQAVGQVLQRFSGAAAWLVPWILLAGLGMAVVLLPSWASLATPYGALLIGKASAFAVLMALAAGNKWRWGPRIATGEPAASRALRRSALTEWALIAAVLTATAVMTTLFSPDMAPAGRA